MPGYGRGMGAPVPHMNNGMNMGMNPGMNPGMARGQPNPGGYNRGGMGPGPGGLNPMARGQPINPGAARGAPIKQPGGYGGPMGPNQPGNFAPNGGITNNPNPHSPGTQTQPNPFPNGGMGNNSPAFNPGNTNQPYNSGSPTNGGYGTVNQPNNFGTVQQPNNGGFGTATFGGNPQNNGAQYGTVNNQPNNGFGATTFNGNNPNNGGFRATPPPNSGMGTNQPQPIRTHSPSLSGVRPIVAVVPTKPMAVSPGVGGGMPAHLQTQPRPIDQPGYATPAAPVGMVYSGKLPTLFIVFTS